MRDLNCACHSRYLVTMSDAPKPSDAALTREERLAAKLRENLRRRKMQGRRVQGHLPSDTSQE